MKESYSPFSLNALTAAPDAVAPQAPWSPHGLRRHFEILARISRIFRQKRLKTFLRFFQPSHQTSILDVGGLPRLWDGLPVAGQITIVNLQPLPSHEAFFLASNQKFVLGNGTRLAWKDQSFDIVFSNSVIEHLGTRENQAAFARETRRVGRAYWIQTPAREFPVEPHFLTLFLHWFPGSAQKRLLRRLSLWGWLARPKPDAVEAAVAEVRLLSLREFKSLYPDGQILVERWLGLPKSYIAYKLPPPPQADHS